MVVKISDSPCYDYEAMAPESEKSLTEPEKRWPQAPSIRTWMATSQSQEDQERLHSLGNICMPGVAHFALQCMLSSIP